MTYVPDRGDIVRTDFNPTRGHEQAGKRPALVLSRILYNRSSGMVVCCPITKKQKGYPFEVQIPASPDVFGVILVDHLRSIDWRARNFQFVTKASDLLMDDVMQKLNTLFA